MQMITAEKNRALRMAANQVLQRASTALTGARERVTGKS